MAKIKLNNVRLSFPSLFRKAVFNGEETKFEATFLLDKDTQADKIAEIEDAIAALTSDKLKGAKLKADKICLKDGDDIEYAGFAGNMSIKASNNKRPMVDLPDPVEPTMAIVSPGWASMLTPRRIVRSGS